MRWLQGGLNRKFAFGTAAGLLISSLVFLILFVGLYREQIARERAGAAEQVTRLLQTSLENAMLKRDLEGLRGIVHRLGDSQGVLAVQISNPAGEVRFASDSALLGEQLPVPGTASDRPSTQMIEDADGRAVLRSVNPVSNKPPCQECHGPIEANPVNGVLYVDFDAAPIRDQARNTTLLLMGAGAVIVLINLAGGWWFMRRFVIGPVGHLTEVSGRLAAGDLAVRTSLSGRDELAVLADRFNRMANSLQQKIIELEEQEQFLQQLVDAIPDGVRVIDKDYRVVLSNATYRQQLGATDGIDAPEHCFEATHGRDRPCPDHLITCPVAEMSKGNAPLRFVHRHQRLDGGSLDVELYAAPMRVKIVGEMQDLVVESIRDLEQEVKFSHEQKLSELGRLAAGVAHEIHNPMAAVKMALHAAEQANAARPPNHHRVSEHLALVDQEIDKCSRVTERLLKLSVPPPETAELVTLDQVVEDNLRLLSWDAESQKIEIRSEVEGAPLRVVATDSELRMAVLNLCQNAMHAMPQGGMLSVRCARDDDRVEARFRDTGVGIAPSDLQRIFEPFFSRRADNVRGTGLGLPITKSIVEQYGGSISVDSTLGEGSEVVVSFPDADRMEGS
jgi:signal transduction histidine kinase